MKPKFAFNRRLCCTAVRLDAIRNLLSPRGPTQAPRRVAHLPDRFPDHEPAQRAYLCNVKCWNKEYEQLQGLGLHYREKHTPSLCKTLWCFRMGSPLSVEEAPQVVAP